MKGLAIKDVAERTGIAAATIRMWEQRYGFPEPARTASGYRIYTDEDVDALRRVAVPRPRPVGAGRRSSARAPASGRDRPALDVRRDRRRRRAVPARRLRKRTLLAISRAIEDETLARAAGPVVIGAFQSERIYRGRRAPLPAARAAPPTPAWCSPTSTRVRERAGPARRDPDRARRRARQRVGGRVDAPGYAACLLAWETPESQRDDHLPDRDRRFEALWTLDPRACAGPRSSARRWRARRRGARARGSRSPCTTGRSPSRRRRRLTALTNRIVGYLD